MLTVYIFEVNEARPFDLSHKAEPVLFNSRFSVSDEIFQILNASFPKVRNSHQCPSSQQRSYS